MEFLTDEQAAACGAFGEMPTRPELERFFFLDDDDRDLIALRRSDGHRLGMAVQIGTVRYIGTFLGDDPLAVPREVTGSDSPAGLPGEIFGRPTQNVALQLQLSDSGLELLVLGFKHVVGGYRAALRALERPWLVPTAPTAACASRTRIRRVSRLTPRSWATDEIVRPGSDSTNATASALTSAE